VVQIIIISTAAVLYTLGVYVFTANCALERLNRTGQIGMMPILVGLAWPFVLAVAIAHVVYRRVLPKAVDQRPSATDRALY